MSLQGETGDNSEGFVWKLQGTRTQNTDNEHLIFDAVLQTKYYQLYEANSIILACVSRVFIDPIRGVDQMICRRTATPSHQPVPPSHRAASQENPGAQCGALATLDDIDLLEYLSSDHRMQWLVARGRVHTVKEPSRGTWIGYGRLN